MLYAYDRGSVAVDNLGPATERGLSVQANVYSLGGRLLSHTTRRGLRLQSGSGRRRPPSLGSRQHDSPRKARTYFVELLLRQHGHVVDRNVYWLSTQRDVRLAQDQGYATGATMTRFANLTALKGLPPAHIRVSAQTHADGGPGGANAVTDVRITNTSARAVAFFLRADVRRGNAAGTPRAGDNQVLPILWNDDDITLWPGESATLRANYRRAALGGSSPVVTVSGWNVARVHASAG